MDLRPLVEVELRDALGPINRAQSGRSGQPGAAVRTVVELRGRAAAGVLDLKLSRAVYLGDTLCGSCLVERVDDSAHLAAVAVEPLAQQRGAGRALIESVCAAAGAAGVKRLSIFVSDFDSALLASLTPIGFVARRTVARYALTGAPAALPQPQDLGREPAPALAGATGACARVVPPSEALPLLHNENTSSLLLFEQQPAVLSRLFAADKLTSYVFLETPEAAPCAAAVFERERKVLLALGHKSGADSTHLAALLCLLAARHGVSSLDALAEGHPAEAALFAAGFARAALRTELVKDL